MKLECIRGHHVWIDILSADSVVVDAGAHRGEFSLEIMRRFGCKCHLVEANPAFIDDLRRTNPASITLAALSGNDGRGVFHIAENPEAGALAGVTSVAPIDVETISLPTLIRRTGIDKIDLLKLDVEGAEFDVIATTPDHVLRRITQLTIEFHDFKSAFRGRRLFETACERLNRLNFIDCNMAFRTHGDVLFINLSNTSLRRPQIRFASNRTRWVKKLKSIANR